MKNVLVKTGDRAFAIDSRLVLEIVPAVELKRSEKDNTYLAGMMQYHGQSIPVIDLCLLLSGRSHQKKFSTRIVLVAFNTQTLGLIAESVTDLVSEDAVFEKLDLASVLASCL
jgi:chemotaxis-related protein WspB